METEKTLSGTYSRLTYLVFTLSGLLMLFFTNDYSWAGINLALVLAFNPFPDTAYRDMSFFQKALIFGQMGLAITMTGAALYLTVIQ